MSRGEPKPAKDARRSGRGKGHPRPACRRSTCSRRRRSTGSRSAGCACASSPAASRWSCWPRAGWTVQHLRISETRKLVAVEQAETARLNSETQVLLPVKAYVAGVAAQQATVKTTMAREIYFSRVLDGIRRATPVGASLDNLAVTLAVPDPAAGRRPRPPSAAPTVSPCPGPDPFNTKTVIGCVTLAGTAATRAQVGELVIALDRIDLFVEPFISTTSAARQHA